LPIAEICRRLADHAAELGLTRPSYVHMRRLVQRSRERRAAVRELRDDVLGASLAGRVVNPIRLADRIRELPPGAHEPTKRS